MSANETKTREELIAELEALQQRMQLLLPVIPEEGPVGSEETRRLLETIIEQSPCGVLIATKNTGRIIFANQEACRIDGAGRKEHLCIDLTAFEQLIWTMHYPDGSPMTLPETPLAKATFHGETTRTQEILLKRADGTECWVLCNGNPLYDINGKIHSGIVTFVEITDQKKAMQKTLESEAGYRRIIGTAIDAYYKADMQGRLVMANPTAVKILGYEHPDQILGKDIARTFYTTPEQRAVFLKELKAQKTLASYRLQLKTADGSPLVVEASSRLIPAPRGGYEGVEGLFRDVTAKVQTEEQLRRSEFFYRTLFEHTGTATVLLGSTGLINRVNSQALALSGYSREELEGKRYWQEMIHPNDLDRLSDYYQRRFGHGKPPPDEYDITIVDKLGNEKFVHARIDILQETKERIVTMTDLTTRRLMEQELETLNRKLEILVAERTEALAKKNEELEAANHRLLELDKVKSNLLSSVSHELRTPLTSIMGFAKVTKNTFEKFFSETVRSQQNLKPRAQTVCNNLEIIAREGARLTRLINELLDLSHVESGKFHWNDSRCDMYELLHMSAESAFGEFQNKNGVEFSFSIPKNIPCVFADRDKIQQVLLNLLNNAAKFTDTGHVMLNATADARWVEINVSDTGIGIPEHLQEHIFDKFYTVRSNDTLHGNAVGTGLGLALCRQVVEHYGGTITVNSKPGYGSTFVVCLPIDV